MRFKCNSYSHACGDWPCGVADSPSRVLCAAAARGELRGASRRVRVSAPRFPPCAWDGRRLAPRPRSRRSCRCHTDGPWGQVGTRPCPARGWRCLSAEPLALWGPACHPQSTPNPRRTAQVQGGPRISAGDGRARGRTRARPSAGTPRPTRSFHGENRKVGGGGSMNAGTAVTRPRAGRGGKQAPLKNKWPP